ncbi:MAG: T9SS type A sorting domain-containing protein [Candidatus Cloacimonetes bacterium]|nr:T9SS type A sorting domain-containing protein [Candidatus Cloacimonadota bacterium]
MNYHVGQGDLPTGTIVTLSDLFGPTPITMDDLESISFYTKKLSADSVPDNEDFFIVIYTAPPGNGGWYNSRLETQPDVGYSGFTSDDDNWRFWTTDLSGPNNQLLFYDFTPLRSTSGEYATLSQLSDGIVPWTSVTPRDYRTETVLMISIQTASNYNGFDGMIDGLTITLENGDVGEVDMTDGITRFTQSPAVPDEELPRVASGAPTGWGADCWQGPASGKINYYTYYRDDEKPNLHGAAVSLDDLFGLDHEVTIGDLKNFSFHTKKPNSIPVGDDFWIQIYTKPISTGWYNSRIYAQPMHGPGGPFYTQEDNVWRLWSTDNAATATPKLYLEDKTRAPGQFGTIEQFSAGPMPWAHDYSGEEILAFSIHTDSNWNGFDGYLDGLSIELKDGRLGEVDFTDGPHLEMVALDPTHISVANGGCEPNTRVSVQLSNLGGSSIFAYHVMMTFPTALNAHSITLNETGYPSLFATATGFGSNGGTIDVSWAQSAATPSSFEGELFQVDFWGDASEDLLAQVQFTFSDFRAPRAGGGFDLVPVLPGDPLTVVVDDTVPAFAATFPQFPLDTCVDGDFTVLVDATDNVDLDKVQYRFDNTGTWIDAITGIVGSPLTGGSFLADVSGLSDNMSHSIQVKLVDDVCYESTEASWVFTKDAVSAAPITNLAASPRHNAVRLSWSGGNGSDSYKLYRSKRVSYPYYNDMVSMSGNDGLPPVGTVFDFVAVIDKDSTGYTDASFANTYTDRGVYDYKLSVYDCANDSLLSNLASATNYFLGDWYGGPGSYNGAVCMEDLTISLSSYYGTTSDPGATVGTWEAGDSDELDVAPTSDFTAFGLPNPDGLINFEDLVIFAINYSLGCTSPLTGADGPEIHKDALIASASSLVLNSVADGQVEIALDGSLMAYSLRINSGQSLLGASCDGALVMSYASADGWVIDVAGNGGMLTENAVLRLNLSNSNALDLEVLAARDGANTPVDLSLDMPEVDALPTSYSLGQNFPNPFNPTTNLRFGLPEAANVRLTVYNTLGQQVRTLVSGELNAGWHNVVLDGSSLASGVYYYRLEANDFTDLHKMVLLK